MIKTISVGLNSCGLAAGAQEVYDTLAEELRSRQSKTTLRIVGCVGMCYREPLVDITEDNVTCTYGEVTKDKANKIFEEHVIGGRPIEQWIVKKDVYSNSTRRTWDIDGYLEKQRKIVLTNLGYIDPENIDEYLETGGYQALRKSLTIRPEEIIETIVKSGLRGRGGAGFHTGLKWRFTREAEEKEKYIVCNGDEGDPGAFMDRNVLEGDPHSVIEGMVIGAYSIGCSRGFMYVRAEYPLAIRRLVTALGQARERGFLGENILGTDFSFDIAIKEGAGAFVCGEETALMASIEGRRGMPKQRPPFPAQKGLWGKPTNINNVETWANIPWILNHGWESFAALGTQNSKGTKIFALAGKIKRGGNVEVPMGLTLREILLDIGGGTKTGDQIKAVQLGGPSGGCIPYRLLDTPVDYDHIRQTGAIMGSGGMVVMDQNTCMVDVAKFFLDFTVKESCGKCSYCRLGTKRMWEILDRITCGKGTINDIRTLEDLAPRIKNGSLCGLGQTAPNPVLTTLKYFREEYLAHIENHKCPAKVCKPLLTFTITDDCIGCTLCASKCSAKAIVGEIKKKHEIVQDKCIKCGTCYQVCPKKAVSME